MIKVLIDENLSQYFAAGLNQMQLPRGDGIIISSIATEFKTGIADEEWIPAWGKQKGIFITQDKNIHSTKQQAQLLVHHQLGAFFLDVPKSYRYWDKVEIIIRRWPEIVDVIKKAKRPFAYKIT